MLIILSSILIPKKSEPTALLPVWDMGMAKLAVEAAAANAASTGTHPMLRWMCIVYKGM